MATGSATRPLDGVRVVTFAQLYQGPYATMVLADLGADVIVVERPGTGDPARAQGVMFQALNRGKRSVTLDLKQAEGRRRARELARTADVLFEAYRPGTMDRFGLGYRELSAINPRLVYVSVSGFGQDGPYRDRAGHDLMYQAAAGLLDALCDRPEAVQPPPDLEAGAIVGALYAALGALAGLTGRAATGHGTHVDVSTHEALLSVLSLRVEDVLNGPGESTAGHEPGYVLYRCADGNLIALGIGFEDHFWTLLCRATGLTGHMWLRRAERLARADGLAADLARVLATRPRAHWLETFDRAGVPAAPVHRLAEALRDPHVAARRTVRTLRGAGRRYVRQPLRLSAYADPDPGPAPLLGEHTGSILRELEAHESPHERRRLQA
ncbi:crotonobetainyl-CoA:carnitine CoA-transferase CaiB-like acyl-CoA transferase [Thermocatellispora tengchongensis]|uniref:Crotonobetainyl-CoA:carnitine CoA-transferase CaiB-like acyl-CoA transferase n=1 Tax=Thermocatellispora tengchongensis TaxID=1073253 RepID=A0A840PEC3_9ACTN|nr:CaiB/BaiF CoA-transferase family protein [Thermocatellispora tengchongensis]MBB5139774.1 crotonobetainyl-CoA:carnitine CoA-transferase CaiB-like acyl-CoA transferase [Thermocatellispora tengchongensis]